MHGIVEIYDSEGTLLHQEDNMAVDGAGKTIVDAWTVSPSLSAVTDASAILDASNYTIHALSFSKDSDGFRNNAHLFSASSQAVHLTAEENGGGIILVYQDLGVCSYNPSATTLPKSPDPIDIQLEPNTNVSGGGSLLIDGEARVTSFELSDLALANGQCLNIIPSRETVLAGFSGLAPFYGCFPEGSSLGTSAYLSRDVTALDTTTSTITTVVASGTLNSAFNSLNTMDVSGFVNRANSGVGDTDITDTGAQVIVKADPGFSSTGEVRYELSVSGDDLAALAMYGGVYSLGLWTIDVGESLRAGNNAPFGFSVLNNPRKYRLFAKKTLTKNLVFHKDDTGDPVSSGLFNLGDLTIVWRVVF